MKLFTIKNSVAIILISASVFACNSSTEKKAEKVEDAKEQVIKATDALDKARADSANDYMAYKLASEKQIELNNEKISELTAKIKKEKAEMRKKNQEELKELDQKNAKLKARIQEYKENDKASWAAFKLSFNQDLDALGKSISTFAEKNMDKK